MTPSRITVPKFEGLEPRGLGVIVNDERAVHAKFKQDTEDHVTQILLGVLEEARIGKAASAHDLLQVDIYFPNSAPTGVSREHCVELRGKMKHQSGFSTEVQSVACPEARVGITNEAQVSRAFDEATNLMFQRLDANFAQFHAVNAPPRFDAARVQLPEFAFLEPKTLSVEVVDEYPGDPEVAQTLKAALDEALPTRGVVATPSSAQKLAITVARPKEGVGGVSADLCLELRGTLTLKSGNASAQSVGCRGSEATTHDAVLNQLLQLLDAEATKTAK